MVTCALRLLQALRLNSRCLLVWVLGGRAKENVWPYDAARGVPAGTR